MQKNGYKTIGDYSIGRFAVSYDLATECDQVSATDWQVVDPVMQIILKMD